MLALSLPNYFHPISVFLSEVFGFLVLVAVAVRLARRFKVSDKIEAKRESIRLSLEEAASGEALLQRAHLDREEHLAQARQEAAALLAQAEQVAAASAAEVAARAGEERDRLLARARREALRLADAAHDQVKRRFAQAVVEEAQAILMEEMNQAHQDRLVGEAVRALESGT